MAPRLLGSDGSVVGLTANNPIQPDQPTLLGTTRMLTDDLTTLMEHAPLSRVRPNCIALSPVSLDVAKWALMRGGATIADPTMRDHLAGLGFDLTRTATTAPPAYRIWARFERMVDACGDTDVETGSLAFYRLDPLEAIQGFGDDVSPWMATASTTFPQAPDYSIIKVFLREPIVRTIKVGVVPLSADECAAKAFSFSRDAINGLRHQVLQAILASQDLAAWGPLRRA